MAALSEGVDLHKAGALTRTRGHNACRGYCLHVCVATLKLCKCRLYVECIVLTNLFSCVITRRHRCSN